MFIQVAILVSSFCFISGQQQVTTQIPVQNQMTTTVAPFGGSFGQQIGNGGSSEFGNQQQSFGNEQISSQQQSQQLQSTLLRGGEQQQFNGQQTEMQNGTEQEIGNQQIGGQQQNGQIQGGIGQQQVGDCEKKCIDEFYRTSPDADVFKLLNLEKHKIGEIEFECPDVNDTVRFNTECGPYRVLRRCIDQCPESEQGGSSQNSSLNQFRGFQSLCIDRLEDVRKYMPCLSEHCVEIEQACAPKCGSFDYAIKQVAKLLRQVRQGNGTSLDATVVTKTFADSCSRLYCLNGCSQWTFEFYCGREAFAFKQDLIWNILYGMFSRLQQLGVNVQWPEECKSFAFYVLRKRL